MGDDESAGRERAGPLWLTGFGRVDLRPHAVGGFDIAAREVEELAVGRMVRFLHALDMRPDCGMLSARNLAKKSFSCAGPTMRIAPASAIVFATSSKNGLFSSILRPVRFSRE